MLLAPVGANSLVQLQRAAGNRVVAGLLSSHPRRGCGDLREPMVQRCGSGACDCAQCSSAEATENADGPAQGHELPVQRAGLDPANEKAWDWYGNAEHRKAPGYLATLAAAKGASSELIKTLAAVGAPKTDDEREAFDKQVRTLVRLNALSMVAAHREGLVKRKTQFEAMLTAPPTETTPGAGAAPSAVTAAADTAAAIRGAAEVVRTLRTEQENLTTLRNTASSAVRVNAGPEAIPGELDTLTTAAQPRSTPAVMQSVLTAEDRMSGLAWGSKKVRLMELGNDLAKFRDRQISGVRAGLASVYEAFPIFATMSATFPATGKTAEPSPARTVAVGIGTATLLATPFAPLAVWLAKDEFAKDKPPDDQTLLAEARKSFDKLLGNTDEAIVKIGSGSMEPLELPGAVAAARNALPEALRAEVDRVKQAHEVAKFTEEMVMALGIAVLSGLTGGLAGLGYAALAATAGAGAAVIGAAQVASQAKDALDRQTIAAASMSPDKTLLGVSAPSMFEWAMLGVSMALTAFDLAMVAREVAALRPKFQQEPPLPTGAKGTDGAGAEQPGVPKATGDPGTPKAGAATAETRVLEAGKGETMPSLEQIEAELAIVEKSTSRPSSVKGYESEVDLGNGHTWRSDPHGNWCRFSDSKVCVPAIKGQATRISDDVIRTEADLDALVAGKRPQIDKPPATVTTPEDLRMWELYNNYFDERIASMRSDLRSETGATKREPPSTFDAFKDRYTKNPELIKALRGRLSQGETGNILADIAGGKVGQNVGVSKVPNPGQSEVVYPDFVFKRAQGDGYTAVTQKRRDFTGMSRDQALDTARLDLREGLEKYYGDRYVRRRGLDQTGQKVRFDELVLNYDPRTVPEGLRNDLREFAEAYEGVDVKIGFFDVTSALP